MPAALAGSAGPSVNTLRTVALAVILLSSACGAPASAPESSGGRRGDSGTGGTAGLPSSSGGSTPAAGSGGTRGSGGEPGGTGGTGAPFSRSGGATGTGGAAAGTGGTLLPPGEGPGAVLPGDRLTGVNWFGFETANLSPHGLWARDYHSMLKQIKDLGFNSIRLPWCNDMLAGTPNSIQINPYGVDPYTKQVGLNADLAGLSSLQVMDKILDECRRLGLRVILDNHSRAADGYMNETLWYHDGYPEDTWISDWVFVINRYRNNPAVVAADLKNEPHGNMGTGMKPPATWGSDQAGYGATDWRKAAIKCGQAILAANPDIMLIVEGVEQYQDKGYWWGGNLAGVRDHPITVADLPARNLWYSAHEYGPEVYEQSWFTDPSFPANLPALWNDRFWFLRQDGIAPLFFGEFGIKEAAAADETSVAHQWLATFMAYVGSKSHWTFWAMNPNSGDTEGILQNDWVTVNPAKLAMIRPYLAAQFAGDP